MPKKPPWKAAIFRGLARYRNRRTIDKHLHFFEVDAMVRVLRYLVTQKV